MVWDTAGQEEFDALTKQYYRNAQGCVIAFSTVDRASFEAVEQAPPTTILLSGHAASLTPY